MQMSRSDFDVAFWDRGRSLNTNVLRAAKEPRRRQDRTEFRMMSLSVLIDHDKRRSYGVIPQPTSGVTEHLIQNATVTRQTRDGMAE